MSDPSAHPRNAAQPLGMRAVVAYKFSKAAVFAVLAIVLFCTNSGWLHQEVTGLSTFLVDHASSRVAAWLADELAKLGTPRALLIVKAALAGDAVVSAAEGYFLRRGYWWAPWVVVVAT